MCVCVCAAGIGVSGSSHWELMCVCVCVCARVCVCAAGIGVSGSSHWELMGDALVTTDYVRLTPDQQSKQGAIWSRIVSRHHLLVCTTAAAHTIRQEGAVCL